MPEKHVREIEKIAVGLGTLKAMLGVSRMDDSEWENVSAILDEFSFRLRTSADGIRQGRIQEMHGFGEAHARGEIGMPL
ncbi:MAG: hypothetical protein GYA56_06625 [Geobacteraceae bacterium]|nr:hypothetical protein [Geobacteraceae bacterium]